MIRAVNDDIIVTIEYDKKSAGGIFLSDGSKSSEGEFHGIVVSVGPDYKEDLKPGDRILFTRHGQAPEGMLIEKDGKKFWRLRSEWVEAVIR